IGPADDKVVVLEYRRVNNSLNGSLSINGVCTGIKNRAIWKYESQRDDLRGDDCGLRSELGIGTNHGVSKNESLIGERIAPVWNRRQISGICINLCVFPVRHIVNLRQPALLSSLQAPGLERHGFRHPAFTDLRRRRWAVWHGRGQTISEGLLFVHLCQ